MAGLLILQRGCVQCVWRVLLAASVPAVHSWCAVLPCRLPAARRARAGRCRGNSCRQGLASATAIAARRRSGYILRAIANETTPKRQRRLFGGCRQASAARRPAPASNALAAKSACATAHIWGYSAKPSLHHLSPEVRKHVHVP